MEKILLIGGDARMRSAKCELEGYGFLCDSIGLFEGDCGKAEGADALLFPAPLTRDGENVFCPLTGRKVPLSIADSARENALILSGGQLPVERKYTNYCTLDDFALLNAVPTAEGAIAAAIGAVDFTLWKSKILVIGMGRVARILLTRLKAFCPLLTVAARSDRDLALLEACGAEFISTSDIIQTADRYDIIFNTVDAPVLDSSRTALESTLIIDLSTKGCLSDTEGLEKYRKLSGIPGKTAPVTAGRIIAQTALKQIKAQRR